jgi:hypothetical protein
VSALWARAGACSGRCLQMLRARPLSGTALRQGCFWAQGLAAEGLAAQDLC